MRSLSIISLCLLFVGGSARGQQAQAQVDLKLTRLQEITSNTAAIIQAKVVQLLETSNFNSKDHPGPICPDGVRGVERRYRESIGGQYLVVTFAQPRHFDLIRGEVTAIEVVVGLNDPQGADALFTIDPDGRIVEHSMFGGKEAKELVELVKPNAKRGEPDGPANWSQPIRSETN